MPASTVMDTFLDDATSGGGRKTCYAYTPVGGSGDDGSLEPNTLRETKEYLAGTLVGHSYTIVTLSQKQEIRLVRPSATINETLVILGFTGEWVGYPGKREVVIDE